MEQKLLDEQSRMFWTELCGTKLAQSLGITNNDKSSLDRFDQAYFDFYPYIPEFVRPEQMRGKKVLEIGLGYCSLSRILASHGAIYTGLDIADGPVFMANHSFTLLGLNGKAIQGSALQNPFPSQTFDFVVSIGCLHHTGNMQQAFNEVNRVLRPGGKALIMVYNRYSFRQWTKFPATTTIRWLKEKFSKTTSGSFVASPTERAAYDANTKGDAAPDTVFTSKREAIAMLKQAGFSQVNVEKKNADMVIYRSKVYLDRPQALKWIGPNLGLDLYILAQK